MKKQSTILLIVLGFDRKHELSQTLHLERLNSSYVRVANSGKGQSLT